MKTQEEKLSKYTKQEIYADNGEYSYFVYVDKNTGETIDGDVCIDRLTKENETLTNELNQAVTTEESIRKENEALKEGNVSVQFELDNMTTVAGDIQDLLDVSANEIEALKAEVKQWLTFLKNISEQEGGDPDEECSLCMGELQQDIKEALKHTTNGE